MLSDTLLCVAKDYVRISEHYAFQIRSGGYQIILKNGKWSQVTGSASKAKRFAKEDRRGHRSEQRKQKKLLHADPKAIARAER
jgi:hypothetical protein